MLTFHEIVEITYPCTPANNALIVRVIALLFSRAAALDSYKRPSVCHNHFISTKSAPAMTLTNVSLRIKYRESERTAAAANGN